MSSRAFTAPAVAAVVYAVAIVHAQTPPLRFTRERPVVANRTGPQRLAIDATLLEAAHPFRVMFYGETAIAEGGLGDLRLVDGNGTLIPHLLIYPPAREPSWVSGTVLPLPVTKRSSGFEIDLARLEVVDMLRVEGLPPPFLKRVTVEGSGDREHWTMLVAEGTMFDLPDERLRETRLGFLRGSYRYLRATWDDTNSGRIPVPQSVFARRTAGQVPPPPPAVTLGVERRPSEPGRSRYRLRLPAARLPVVALDLDIGGAHVFRPATVTEPRLSGEEALPAQLGKTTLVHVLRNGAAAQALRIPITPPAEAELELVIEDGSNPPLDVKRISAVFAELPWIYFEAPAGPIVAKYGDPVAAAPRYDLEALRDSIDVSALRDATWGEPRTLQPTGPTAPAEAVPDTGASIDPSTFRYIREINDKSGRLVALPFDAAVLSHSRGPAGRFADVRVIDPSNRQVPYLLERRDEPLSIDVQVTAATPEQSAVLKSLPNTNRSIYLVRLPYPNVPAGTLVIETSGRVFQRNVQLGIARPSDRHRRDAWFDVIAGSTWRHADQGTPAPALTLAVSAGASTELLLVVDEGDNAPLPITSMRLLLPSYRIRFFRPSEQLLRLAYGRTDLPAPRYDLSLLAPQVMGAAAREIVAERESAGPPSAADRPFVSPRTFWIFLSVAVLALLMLIVRLMRAH